MVSDDRNGLLQDVVSELVGDKPLDDLVHTELTASRLMSELSVEALVVPVVSALEDLIDLVGCLIGFQALFDHIRAEFELTESDKISSNEVEDLVISQRVLKFEHVLNQVVAVGIFNQIVNATDDHVSQGEFLLAESLLKASLHDTAAMFVRADLVTVGHTSLEDELSVSSIGSGALLVWLFGDFRGLESEKEGLNDMVAVGVSAQIEDVLGHLRAKREDFLVKSIGLVAKDSDQGLNGSGSMKVHCYLNN